MPNVKWLYWSSARHWSSTGQLAAHLMPNSWMYERQMCKLIRNLMRISTVNTTNTLMHQCTLVQIQFCRMRWDLPKVFMLVAFISARCCWCSSLVSPGEHSANFLNMFSILVTQCIQHGNHTEAKDVYKMLHSSRSIGRCLKKTHIQIKIWG